MPKNNVFVYTDHHGTEKRNFEQWWLVTATNGQSAA